MDFWQQSNSLACTGRHKSLLPACDTSKACEVSKSLLSELPPAEDHVVLLSKQLQEFALALP